MSINMIAYKGRDNVKAIRLLVSGQIIDASELTKVELAGRKGSINSIDDAEFFELTETEVRVKLGLTSLVVGRDTLNVIGYDIENIQGIQFGTINLTMVAELP